MKIIFCADPLNDKVVDMEYEHEYECARKLGLDVHLISLEAVLDGDISRAVKRIPAYETSEMFIYRGWMMKPHHYEQLYHALRLKNAVLINSPSEYIHGHYFPYSYQAIQEETPFSIWFGMEELTDGFEVLLDKMHVFENKPVMIKDYVKSRKHEWEEACFIPDASDQQRVQMVLRNFIERQGAELNGGIVIREFIPLEQLTKHPKSGMPLSNEYRLFFLQHKLIASTSYWDEVNYREDIPGLDSFTELAKNVDSPFFTMDIAKTASGEWTVIEIGDGQVSGLPSHADPAQFYRSMMEIAVSEKEGRFMSEERLYDRIKGGLYGVAVGDALGGTTEFMTDREIQAQYGYLKDIIGGGVWQLEPGEVTDDTMMTLCVAEGILQNPAEPMEPIGRLFMEWYHSKPKDIGNTIRHVFKIYKDNWYEAAFLADLDLGQSGGNGSLMRCLPVALSYTDMADIERVTRMQSKMTHYDETCSDACVLYNRIADRLLRGEELQDAIMSEAAGTEYEGYLKEVPDCEPSGYVVHTFRWVLHILMNAADFSEVVQQAANLGGDSDTIGAIAGGLAGIYYGYEGIPVEYVDAILIKERLDRIASQLYSNKNITC